ncbi:MAG: hypothetical protein ACRDG7_12440 [Candidatus Limnocylindria bacterium]
MTEQRVTTDGVELCTETFGTRSDPAEDPWRKPAPELVERFHAAVAGIEGLEVRKMFGFPAAFIGGNMTAGLHRLAAGWSTFVERAAAYVRTLPPKAPKPSRRTKKATAG